MHPLEWDPFNFYSTSKRAYIACTKLVLLGRVERRVGNGELLSTVAQTRPSSSLSVSLLSLPLFEFRILSITFQRQEQQPPALVQGSFEMIRSAAGASSIFSPLILEESGSN